MKETLLSDDRITVTGVKYRRDTHTFLGVAFPRVGYIVGCSNCVWKQRVDGPKRDALAVARRHTHQDHGMVLKASSR